MWAAVELRLGFVATMVLFSALQASPSSNIALCLGWELDCWVVFSSMILLYPQI